MRQNQQLQPFITGQRIAALIVAAGLSRRMHRFKPLMTIGSTTVISRIVATLQQAGADPVVVVTGHEAQRLEAHLKTQDVVCLRNEGYKTNEMFDSVKIGLAWLKDQCDRVLCTAADMPLFTLQTVQTLLAERGPVVIPTFEEELGNPLVLSADLIPGLLQDQGEQGLRGALQRSGQAWTLVPTADRGVRLDADTPEDFEQLLAHHNRQLLRPQVSVVLARERPFFGQTAARLLRLIRQTGSVATSCQRMRLSYSKGWQLIHRLEDELGQLVVERRQGGVGGGSSELTKAGEELLSRFDVLLVRAREAVNDVFKQVFTEESDE